MKKALVTGATGFVGVNLCRELVKNGYQVRALHRAGSDISSLKDLDLELVCGDVTDRESILRATQGQELVFHIAALFRQAKHGEQVYYDVNVEGTRNVLDAACECGVRRVIHCSTVGVHSHIPHPPANENEEYRPGDIYQSTKCEGEKLARSYFEGGKIEGVVIRPAMIWGPGDRRTLKIFKGIARRRFPLIGSGRTLVHWVLVGDLARAFRLAAETEQVAGQVYIIAGERAVELEEMLAVIARCFGVKPPRLKIPAWPIQLLGSIVEKICVPFNIEPPIYRRRVDFYTKTRSFSWEKAKKELGYQPSHSFKEEVKLIAEWYRSQGWIS